MEGIVYEPLKADLPKKDQASRSGTKQFRHLGVTFAFVFSIALISLLYLHQGPPAPFPVDSHEHTHYKGETQKCPSGLPPPASPPAPVNLWASLDLEDAVQIRQWLEAPERGLNLTRIDSYKTSDNTIYNLEAHYPPKADALAYLESPFSVPVPDRYARVTIHHGARLEPVVKDYLVGPIPVNARTEIREMVNSRHRKGIPYNARGYNVGDKEFHQFIGRVMSPLANATKELFGTVALGLPDDTMVGDVSAPFSYDGEFRRLWLIWRHNVAGSYLQVVGFFQYIDISGTDPSQWKVLKIVYNHQIFNSTESFLAAFQDGTLKRSPLPPHKPADLSWSSRKRIGPQRDLDHLPGPRSVSFAGLRFKVDRKLQYVSWMGWGLYLGFDRDMGLSLWDIRMRNERIVYELAPQDALAHYAGNDPIQSSTAYLDRYFGMGAGVRDMFPGYDCPHEAVYLPATTHTDVGTITSKRAVCIFEQDTGRPLTRHVGFTDGESGAVKGYVLTIRSISTVGNYDYLFDYILHLDGTIEVRISASGYLQGGFWESTQGAYGTKIRDTSMGSLHDHVINYKVDLDVAGLQNSLLHTSMRQEEVTQPWFDDEWGQTVIQQTIKREYITNENHALLKYTDNFRGKYAFVNQQNANRWGSPRGYSIHPGYSPVHNTVVGSKRLLNNANWARYNLAVSVRKDSEPTSSSMWNANLPGAPIVDFHDFFDGENITQQDLVAWVNLGTHHLPGAEDSPNTKTNTAASSFFLTPLNYFDYDISIDLMNAILLADPKRPEDAFRYDDYGVKPAHCLPEAPPPFEYQGVEIHDQDGNLAPPMGLEEMRRVTESYHRIQMEL